MSYVQRVIENLGPYSTTHAFPQLLGEWYASGFMEDAVDAEQVCDVCGHEHIRYLFEIKNRLNGNVREKSGSKCILKFAEIGVRDGSVITYDPVRKQKVLSNIVEEHKKAVRTQLRRETAKTVLLGLQNSGVNESAAAIMNDISQRIEAHSEENALLTPKQFGIFVWAAQVTGVDIPLDAFKGILNFRKGKTKDQLDGMPEHRLAFIRRVLTPNQVMILEEILRGPTPF